MLFKKITVETVALYLKIDGVDVKKERRKKKKKKKEEERATVMPFRV